MPPPVSAATHLTITNPLVLYRSLIATRRIEPSEPQHRLAIRLQDLYHRLKDYEPTLDYAHRLQQISTAIPRGNDGLGRRSSHFLASVRAKKANADSLALTRSLTSADAAKQMQSPKGLLLHGDVGTGKSMLVDLLATSLPTGKKARWHFSAFMLETFSRLERVRKERAAARLASTSDGRESVSNGQSEALVVLARDLVEHSPIVFLDEFQLPDRASAKILSSLFTAFFQLGGVLIATSNRMPEELAKAAGVEIAPPPISGASWARLKSLVQGTGRGDERKSLFGSNADFAEFLDVLKARCETWDMGTGRDWRRREADAAKERKKEKRRTLTKEPEDSELEEDIQPDSTIDMDDYLPPNYHLSSSNNISTSSIPQSLQALLITHEIDAAIPWTSYTLSVYARPLVLTHTYNGTALCTFSSICASNLGPADYISIASTFHTLILTEVPTLSFLQKNEARRLITLLDALYEAHCRLVVSAEADPDNIFFPEIKPKKGASPSHAKPSTFSEDSTKEPPGTASTSSPQEHEDATYAETFSDMYQDMTSPFRPNISTYEAPSSTPSYTSSPLASLNNTTAHPSARSILADEDADFGPVYGSGRSSGASAGSDYSHEKSRPLNFQDTLQFTGADERFAFARARSRLWEMTGERWWEERPLEDVNTWWRPMSKEGRGWEGERSDGVGGQVPEQGVKKDINIIEADAIGEYPNGATSPFRTSTEPPPKFSWMHAWGMVTWGKKAGAWGKGVGGLGARVERKTEDTNMDKSHEDKDK